MPQTQNPEPGPGLSEVLDALPGGRHIRPHATAGPFHLLAITDRHKPHWTVEKVLGDYAPVRMPSLTAGYVEDTDGFDVVEVVQVPHFVAELMSWYTNEDFVLADDSRGEFAYAPSEREWGDFLVELLDPSYMAKSDALRVAAEKAVPALGWRAVADFLVGLPEPDRASIATAAAALSALAAAPHLHA